MFGRYRQCSCMNNNFQNTLNDAQNDMMEDNYSNMNNSYSCNQNDYMDCCECGFDEENSVFPENPMFGQSYVPIQYMNQTFRPNAGLKMGTIFPELVSPYVPGQSMSEIAYIEGTNTIGEGCNKCQ